MVLARQKSMKRICLEKRTAFNPGRFFVPKNTEWKRGRTGGFSAGEESVIALAVKAKNIDIRNFDFVQKSNPVEGTQV